MDNSSSFFKFIFILGCAGSLVPHRLFSSCGKWGLLSSRGAQASLCSGFSCGARAPGPAGLSSCGSRALERRLSSCGATYRLSYSAAHGIILDQGSNLCLLHWQVDSLPLSPRGSPHPSFFFFFNCCHLFPSLVFFFLRVY